MCWDEENRLSAIHDRGEMSNLSVYLYNDAGERVWKLTGDEMQVQVNGITSYSNVNFDKTLYASPYLVMDEHEYTKHYYIEGERVCSKIGGGFGPADVLPTSTPLNFIVGDETDCSENLFALTKRFVLCTGYSGEWEISHTLQPAYNTNNDFENKQYFYHPDHLGSSSFITNALGRAEQHLQYLPFGELWINQRTSEFDSPYKFSAKELDSESGYNYFGARYYDSEASIWLSVDPMADARSWVSPYSYCQNSPVMRVDPSGALDDEWEVNIDTGEKKKVGDKGGDTRQYVSLVNNQGENVGNTDWAGGREDVHVGPVANNYEGDWNYGVANVNLWSDIPDEYLGHYMMWDLKERYKIMKRGDLGKNVFDIDWVRQQESQFLPRSEMSWSMNDYRNNVASKYGSYSSIWMAVETGMLTEIMPSFTPGRLKSPNSFRSSGYAQSVRNMRLSSMPTNISKNPWIRFLQLNKGKYKGMGKNWIYNAKMDYNNLK